MGGSSGSHFEALLLALLAFIALIAGVSRRIGTPYPIILVLAGLLLSLVPGIPRVELKPDLVFFVFLPPLLYAAAWQLSWQRFFADFVEIGWLALGLVVFTVVLTSFLAGFLLPDFDWRSGFLLGAVVAATDPIAATATARGIGLPQHIAHLLEAESLVNDGTGLLALQFGLAILLQGTHPGIVEGSGRLLYLIGAGTGVGAAIGFVIAWFEQWVEDGPVEIVISVLVPYVAYLAGDRMHASGVLAVIACGMVMSRQNDKFLSGAVRLQLEAVWEALTFVLNGIVFLLIGLQLPYVRSQIRGMHDWRLFAYGLGFSACAIILRLAWVFGVRYGRYFVRLALHPKTEEAFKGTRPKGKEVFLLGWTGMRGVLSLTAAVALPQLLPDGRPFTQRNLIVFLTFSVIMTTLVLQGLTLPVIIRWLGLTENGDQTREEEDTRRLLLVAALDAVERKRYKERPELTHIYQELESVYESRLAAIPRKKTGRSARGAFLLHEQRKNAALAAVAVERAALSELQLEGRANDETVRVLQRELDLAESRVHTSGSLL